MTGPHARRLRRHEAQQHGLRHHAARIARRLVDPVHAGRRRHRAFAGELHGRHAQHGPGQDLDAAGAVRRRLPARRADHRPGADRADDPRRPRDALLLDALAALAQRLAIVDHHERRLLPDVEQAGAVPGRLQDRTFIRNHIVTRDGRILLPFQHYIGPEDESAEAAAGPRRSPTRATACSSAATAARPGASTATSASPTNDRYFGWAENNIVELSDGRDRDDHPRRRPGRRALLRRVAGRRADLAGVRQRRPTSPIPARKATLYPLGGDAVAMLHNPEPQAPQPAGAVDQL